MTIAYQVTDRQISGGPSWLGSDSAAPAVEGARINGPDSQSLLSPDCPDAARALPKVLGLRLEPGKGPVEYLVVERAEKPTDN